MRKVLCIGFGERDAADICRTAIDHGIEHRNVVWDTTSDKWRKSLCDYLKEYGKPPTTDEPYWRLFEWRDFYAFSDNNYPKIDYLEYLFPNSYYIFDNRSLYNWIICLFDTRGFFHFSSGEIIPKLDLESLQQSIIERKEYYSYCQQALKSFQEDGRCAVIDLEQDDSLKIQSALQAAIEHPIELTYIENIKRNARSYVKYPAFIEEALRKSGIPESEWHQTVL